jgi:putative transposase
MTAAIRALSQQETESRDNLEESTHTIYERYKADIPKDDTVRAFALCIWKIHQQFLEICVKTDVPSKEIVEGSNILWWLEDTITDKVIAIYNQLDVEQRLIDFQQRSNLVRRLLTGKASPHDMKSAFLDSSTTYSAVRCVSSKGFSSGDQRWLESSGSLPNRRAVLALIDDEYLGLMARRPKLPDGVLVAFGPEVSLTDLVSSFDVADRVCHVSKFLGLTGIQTLEDLSWRVAGVDKPVLAASMRQRFLDPIRAEGTFGKDIETSMRSYFAHDMNLADTAHALNLHVNTLRYRIRRFSEITHVDLGKHDDQFNVLWALELADIPPWTPRLR